MRDEESTTVIELGREYEEMQSRGQLVEQERRSGVEGAPSIPNQTVGRLIDHQLNASDISFCRCVSCQLPHACICL